MLLRYTQALMAQVAQTALCNRYHSIDQQLCRRLLLGLDRSAATSWSMTQEGVAGLLGVRREGVTAAALKLQHGRRDPLPARPHPRARPPAARAAQPASAMRGRCAGHRTQSLACLWR